ncbi:MAG: hypothetical protein CVU31_07010 [Betaproteobacteria bacterium HGW-Betaproteobacteria-4]|nr:MAG: hypothetical protein CVU31_07010 [Betaproteobacteria bacterium HGW-Betaproteobacteria-4]
MYRVKTTYRTGTDRPIIEHGPWHDSRKVAEHWAEQLRIAGYAVSIESQNIHTGGGGGGDDDNADLAAALAGMA